MHVCRLYLDFEIWKYHKAEKNIEKNRLKPGDSIIFLFRKHNDAVETTWLKSIDYLFLSCTIVGSRNGCLRGD